MTEKQRCSYQKRRGWHSIQCSYRGTLEHEGKMYCKIHHPPTAKAKRDKKRDEWFQKRKLVSDSLACAAKLQVAERRVVQSALKARYTDEEIWFATPEDGQEFVNAVKALKELTPTAR